MAQRPERNHEAYNIRSQLGLRNLGSTSLDNIITIWAYDG